MKKKISSKIFKNIENVRKKNNKNWMDLLRLAYDVKPKETISILSKILKKDGELIRLASKLKKITK
tara:strand:- start:10270 stop:10467 length:198 start_codon:yes stop_codon:yes gene_type:complete